jgi:hypothetical protein
VEFSDELVLIAGEAFAGMKVHVEPADESFVVAAETADDGGETGLDLLGVFGFEVVVKQDHNREREGFRGEKFHTLFDIVIEDAEFVAGEVGNKTAFAVFYGDRQKYVVYGKFQGSLAVGRVLLIRGDLGVLRFGLRLRWCVLWNLWDRRGGWLLGEKATGRAKQAGHQQGQRDEKLRFSWTFHGLPARILSAQDARASL